LSAFNEIKKAVRKVSGRPAPRVLSVKNASHLTPNMIRVTFAGPELENFPTGREGGNCKIMLPEPNESREHFSARLSSGSALAKRTYTVRSYRQDLQELDIDFVAHGDSGPASRWAMHAKPGDFLGFAGPSAPKVNHFEADWYLFAADLSALPMAAATLEAMPRNATGVAVFEVTAEEDRQQINSPPGIDIHWLFQPNPHVASTQQEDFICAIDWPEGRVQTCVAGESAVIRSLRDYLYNEKKTPRNDVYISGYWKIGLVEDEHQKFKRAGG